MLIGDKLNLIQALGSDSKALDKGFEIAPSSLRGYRVRDYKPEPSAKKMHNLIASGVDKVLWRGAMGCGKTFSTMKQLITLAYHSPADRWGIRESRHLVCRNTYRELRDTSIVSFFSAWPSEFPLKWSKAHNEGITEFKRKDDGTTVKAKFMFWAFDNDKDFSKLKSFNCTSMYLQEGCELDEKIWEFGCLRVGRYPDKKNFDYNVNLRKIILIETNSFDYDHWLYQLFYVKNKNNKKFGIVESGNQLDPAQAENLKWLPDNFYEDVIATNSPEFVDINVRNKFGKYRDAKLVYNAFNEKYHICDEPIRPEDGPIFAGIDNSLNAAVVVVQKVANQRYKLIWSRQIYNTGMNTSLMTMFREAYDLFPPNVWKWEIGGRDPIFSRRQEGDSVRLEVFCQSAENKYGVCKTVAAESGTNLDIRINAVNEKFATRCGHTGKPLLMIHISCTHMIEAIRNYVYDKVKGDVGGKRYKDKPTKNRFADPCNALEYALLRPKDAGLIAKELGYNYTRDESPLENNESPYKCGDVMV